LAGGAKVMAHRESDEFTFEAMKHRIRLHAALRT
jgi:hypothetical protein